MRQAINYCNKCGYFGEGQQHARPGTESLCDYSAYETKESVEFRQLESQLAEARREAAEAQAFLKELSVQVPEKPDYWSACGQCDRNIGEAQDLIEGKATALQSAIEAAVAPYREDAERYRWLRDCNISDEKMQEALDAWYNFAGKQMDTIIDTARCKP